MLKDCSLLIPERQPQPDASSVLGFKQVWRGMFLKTPSYTSGCPWQLTLLSPGHLSDEGHEKHKLNENCEASWKWPQHSVAVPQDVHICSGKVRGQKDDSFSVEKCLFWLPAYHVMSQGGFQRACFSYFCIKLIGDQMLRANSYTSQKTKEFFSSLFIKHCWLSGNHPEKQLHADIWKLLPSWVLPVLLTCLYLK